MCTKDNGSSEVDMMNRLMNDLGKLRKELWKRRGFKLSYEEMKKETRPRGCQIYKKKYYHEGCVKN